MKKLSLYLLVMLLSLTGFANTSATVEKNPTTTTNPTEMPAEVKTMLARLNEIKAMDKSSLTSSDKKELRKEVRTIKKSLKAAGNGGVYLSIGAIIIIILLLILIL